MVRPTGNRSCVLWPVCHRVDFFFAMLGIQLHVSFTNQQQQHECRRDGRQRLAPRWRHANAHKRRCSAPTPATLTQLMREGEAAGCPASLHAKTHTRTHTHTGHVTPSHRHSAHHARAVDFTR